jgi:hypothetical protein
MVYQMPSLGSRLTFSWVTGLLVKGAGQKVLHQEDLPLLPPALEPALCSNFLWQHWIQVSCTEAHPCFFCIICTDMQHSADTTYGTLRSINDDTMAGAV